MPDADETRGRCEQLLKSAATALMEEEPSLFDGAHQQGEVAVSHRLAMYMARDFEKEKGVFVDVELHRDGRGTKPSPVGEYARPDIVVHRRDPDNAGNLLAVEVKWDDEDREKVKEARKKLAGYLGPRLRYSYAALLTIPRDTGAVKLEWVSAGSTGELATAPVVLHVGMLR